MCSIYIYILYLYSISIKWSCSQFTFAVCGHLGNPGSIKTFFKQKRMTLILLLLDCSKFNHNANKHSDILKEWLWRKRLILLSVLLYETCWRTDLLQLVHKVSSSLQKWSLFVVDFFGFTVLTDIVVCKVLYFDVSKTSIQKFPYRFSIPLLFIYYFLSHVIYFQE